MRHNVWTPIDEKTLKQLGIHVHFKGKGDEQSTKRNIPKQTEAEAGLQGNAINYANSSMPAANNLLSSIGTVAGGAGDIFSQMSSGNTSLMNGLLPTSFAANRQLALNSDLQGTIGNALNNLNSRGILNSTITNGALNQISSNAADALAKNYTSDLGAYSNLLGNNVSNYNGLLTGLNSNANALSNNTSDLFKTMYSGRLNSGGSTTTSSQGKGSSAGQALGMYMALA